MKLKKRLSEKVKFNQNFR